MIIDLFGERLGGCLFYILLEVLLCPSSRVPSILFNQWILNLGSDFCLQLGSKKTVTFHFGGWHQPSACQHTFFFLFCKLHNTLSAVPGTAGALSHPTDPWGSRHPTATLILLPIIVITSNVPLMVKYCHLASDIPEFCERDDELYLLTPSAQESTTERPKDARASPLAYSRHHLGILYWLKRDHSMEAPGKEK